MTETQNSDVLIACANVSYRYGSDRWANERVNLRVMRGDVCCLLGPNGAGKTTLLRQLSGELSPTSGTIRIAGMDPVRDASRLGRVMGVVPQGAGLFPTLTVSQHVAHFARLKGVPSASRQREIERVVAECELGTIIKARAAELSVGQQRRVLIALALLGDPDVLVLDEPSVGLDPIARRRLWGTINAQVKRGKTALITTHYLDEAEVLADQVAILNAGRLVGGGTVTALCESLGPAFQVSTLGRGDAGGALLGRFASLSEAHQFVAHKQLQDVVVKRVSLEDVYVSIFGGELQTNLGVGGVPCDA